MCAGKPAGWRERVWLERRCWRHGAAAGASPVGGDLHDVGHVNIAVAVEVVGGDVIGLPSATWAFQRAATVMASVTSTSQS